MVVCCLCGVVVGGRVSFSSFVMVFSCLFVVNFILLCFCLMWCWNS